MGSWYLCHLTFTFFKFIIKNFLFLEIVSATMVSPNIFLIFYKMIMSKILYSQ